MVCSAKWISSLLIGLLLSAGSLPVMAQQAPYDDDGAGDQQYQDTSVDASTGYSRDMDEEEQTSTPSGTGTPSPAPSPPSNDEPQPVANGQEKPERGENDVEVFRERFPNGSIKIEREVTQDSARNYINHGAWKEMNQKGELIAQGQFDHGNRTGNWVRWYRSPSEAKTLGQAPFTQSMTPLISQATFKNGLLDGAWTIFDAKKQKLSQIEFLDGKRHGTASLWYSNGRRMRQVQYRDGDIDGALIEWGTDGKVTRQDTFQQGRKLAQKTTRYPDGKKQTTGVYLFAKLVEKTPDDWADCKFHTTMKTGEDERHGGLSSWYPNGRQQMEGTFEHDVQTGQFTWWHANGQKSLEGRFVAGKQDGPWTWWHANGQKAVFGSYQKGNPTGQWTGWTSDGKVAQSADLSTADGVVIETAPVPETKTKADNPHAKMLKPPARLKR